MNKIMKILTMVLAMALTVSALALPALASPAPSGEDYYGDDYYDDDYYDEYYYEEYYENEDQVAAVFFWILFIFMGILLPVGLMALGLILPNVKKLGKPKYWYALAVSAGVWLVIALFITLMIIIL